MFWVLNMSEFWIFINFYNYDIIMNIRRMQLWKSCEKLGHFDKHFEETPQENILKIVILDTLKIAFWMEKLTQRWTFWPLFPKPGHFFRFSLLPRTCSPVVVTEFASISLNMPKYLWKNCSAYAMALNMHDHLAFSTVF